MGLPLVRWPRDVRRGKLASRGLAGPERMLRTPPGEPRDGVRSTGAGAAHAAVHSGYWRLTSASQPSSRGRFTAGPNVR